MARDMMRIGPMGVRRFEDLEAWRLGRDLRREIYRLAGLPAVARHFELRDQLVSSAASVCANIAEGFGRRSHADFARFLTMSSGSVNEVRNHLTDIVDRHLLTEEEVQTALEFARRTAAALAGLTAYLRRTQTPVFNKHKGSSA